jgi:phosphatidylglycerophosphate synthase
VIRQAALYLSTADDLQTARLPVAGHPVVFRIIMAAIRAGARRVGVPAVLRSPGLEAALAASPRARVALAWLDTAGALAAEPTLLLPAAALAPAPVLGRLLQASPGRVLAESQSSAAPALTVDASLLAVLHPALVAGAPVGDALRRELKARDHPPIPGGGWFVHVTGERAAAEAEACLRRDLGSPVDSWLDTALHRRLSKPVTRVAVAFGVAPNPITVISGVVGLAAAASMALGDATTLVIGLLLYLLAVVLDHADGEVARLTLTESAIGEWLDIVMDTLVHIALVLALGVAAERVTGAGLAAGVVGAVGVVASAVVYKRWPPAPPTAADRGLLDALTSRDGFYAMLLIFIALRLAAPSRLPGLMMLIAVGTHAYWVARAALSLRPGRARGRRP